MNMQNSKGMTALHYAAQRGDLKLVALLLRKKASLTLTTRQGKTAVDLASTAEVRQALQAAVEAKAATAGAGEESMEVAGGAEMMAGASIGPEKPAGPAKEARGGKGEGGDKKAAKRGVASGEEAMPEGEGGGKRQA